MFNRARLAIEPEAGQSVFPDLLAGRLGLADSIWSTTLKQQLRLPKV